MPPRPLRPLHLLAPLLAGFCTFVWATDLPKAPPAPLPAPQSAPQSAQQFSPIAAPANTSAGAALEKREIRAQLTPRRYTTLAAEIGAKVQRIGARADPVSQSVKLSAAIDGKFSELIAGMSGRVTLTPPADSK